MVGEPIGSRCVLAIALLATVACECGDASPAPSPPPAPPRPRVAAPRSVATAAAFDLVPTPDGARLFFGPPRDVGGGLRSLALGPLGEPEGDDVAVWSVASTASAPQPPHVIEIAAASGGGRVGVTWVARHGRQLRVHASHGTGGTFSPAEDLGPTEEITRVARGNIAIAGATDGTLMLIHRRDRGPCRDGARDECTRITVRRLGAEGESIRDGIPLVIPEVCDEPLPGYVWADGTWYYALCALTEGVAETTIYAIRSEPQYARADQVLRGCAPLGLGRVGEGAALILGVCAGGRVDGVRFAEMGTERAILSGLSRRLSCVEGRPRIVVESGSTHLELRLQEAAANLGALLPEEVAPEGSRAVWTGQALLVATPLGGAVSIRRYECEDGVVSRTDQP